MTFVWWALLALLLVFGFLGCFVNKIPGPIFVVGAMLIAILALDIDVNWGIFGIVTGLAIASIILSKVLVKLVKKMQEFSKRAAWGTTIGSLIGLFSLLAASQADSSALIIPVSIIGFIVVPFCLAFVLELTKGNGAVAALKSSASATCAYLADSFLKLVVFSIAVYVMFFK